MNFLISPATSLPKCSAKVEWARYFLAEDERLGRKVAIKTMKREFAANKLDRERFLRESLCRVLALEHDNIVPILHISTKRLM